MVVWGFNREPPPPMPLRRDKQEVKKMEKRAILEALFAAHWAIDHAYSHIDADSIFGADVEIKEAMAKLEFAKAELDKTFAANDAKSAKEGK